MFEQIDIAAKTTIVVCKDTLSGALAIILAKKFIKNLDIVCIYDGCKVDIANMEGNVYFIGYSVAKAQRQEIENNDKIKNCVILQDRTKPTQTMVCQKRKTLTGKFTWTFLGESWDSACSQFMKFIFNHSGENVINVPTLPELGTDERYLTVYLFELIKKMNHVKNWVGIPSADYKEIQEFVTDELGEEYYKIKSTEGDKVVKTLLTFSRSGSNLSILTEPDDVDDEVFVIVLINLDSKILNEVTVETNYQEYSARISGAVMMDSNDYVVSLYSPQGIEYDERNPKDIMSRIAKTYGGEAGEYYCIIRMSKEEFRYSLTGLVDIDTYVQ